MTMNYSQDDFQLFKSSMSSKTHSSLCLFSVSKAVLSFGTEADILLVIKFKNKCFKCTNSVKGLQMNV